MPASSPHRRLFSTVVAAASSAASGASSSASTAPSGKQLYRDLLRQIKQLPKGPTRVYYRNYTRQYFANWNEEGDPQVLQQLHDKARRDAAWVLAKYDKPSV